MGPTWPPSPLPPPMATWLPPKAGQQPTIPRPTLQHVSDQKKLTTHIILDTDICVEVSNTLPWRRQLRGRRSARERLGSASGRSLLACRRFAAPGRSRFRIRHRALNTIECRVTGFTPFRLLYGSDAMTPQEIKHGSPRTVTSAVPDVDEPTSKDLIDGDRVFALQALNKYQAQTKAWRHHTVIPREFSEGDLVLVRTARTESRGKLEPKWEGPFIVKTKASPSAYRLTTPSGEDLEHSWNIDNLRKFLV
jgi:hypothetical protein